MGDVPPPSYSNTASLADQPKNPDSVHDGHVLPEYTLPTKFKIGSSETPNPLVSISQIKGHLALLHAFAELRKTVETTTAFSSLPYVPEEKDRKWGWFVGLAVERFDLWCGALQTHDSNRTNPNSILPPIDVLMVWHAYMLNPRWYMEDTMRLSIMRPLQCLEHIFKQLLEDPSLVLSEDISMDRQQLWQQRTLLPFDYFSSAYVLTMKTLSCPTCQKPLRVALMDADGTGYLQQNFTVSCHTLGCLQDPITKDVLALHKLCRDLSLTPGSGETINYLPGSLFPVTGGNLEKGRKMKDIIVDRGKAVAVREFALGLYPNGTPRYEAALTLGIMKHLETLPNAWKRMQTPYAGPPFVARVMSAYSDEKIYSVELVGAVLRQGSFVEKMYDLEWTRPDYFHGAQDELVLHIALARYHAFLDLMSSSVGAFFVPTLDIDLVWHTHQLMPRVYEADCDTYLKRFIDHDDKVEGLRLSSAFDLTCSAWKQRFNVPYTYCGCPLPGDTIGQRLSRIMGKYARIPPSQLLPVDRLDSVAATHPSDHNAVRFRPQTEAAHKLATRRYEQLEKAKQKAREKALKKAEKEAKAKGGVSVSPVLPPHLQDPRRTGDTRDLYIYQTAFLVPIPLFIGAGLVGAGALGGCVSNGGLVNSSSGCSGAAAGTSCAASANGCAGAGACSGGMLMGIQVGFAVLIDFSFSKELAQHVVAAAAEGEDVEGVAEEDAEEAKQIHISLANHI